MQISFFDGTQQYKIRKPIRLIELFAGIGSQAKALENIGVDFEHYRICEFDKYAVTSYNAIHGTNFTTSDITKLSALDLGIVDTDKYEYIMTYSFPCQDLSNAGKGLGMAKGSGTRSGLLWEVERLLDECNELPQVLIMENVPAVIGNANIEHFSKWLNKLESLGYKNKWQLLNSKDFGIPQNRQRCFMISILGDYYYEFPKTIPLTLRLKDMLEQNVDEKYYLSDSMLKYIVSKDDTYKVNENSLVINRDIACTINTRVGNTRADASDFICANLPDNYNIKTELKIIEPIIYDDYNSRIKADQNVIGTLTTNCGNDAIHNGVKIIEPKIQLRTKNKRLVSMLNKIDISKTQAIDMYNQSVNEEMQTITTRVDASNSTAITQNYRIRKLTPKECWRLMGFDDCDIDKAISVGVSNSQLYKQAGNSIVVNVLEAIFKQLF